MGLKAKATDGGFRIDEFRLGTADGNTLIFNANGNIQDLAATPKIDFQVDASAPDPPAIGKILGLSVPELSPVKVEGKVNGKLSNLDYSIDTFLGGTRISSRIKIAVVSGRPRINGKVFAKTVDLREIGIYPETPPTEPIPVDDVSPSRKRLFGDKPLLPYDTLRAVDLSLTLDVEKLIDKDIRIRDLDVDIGLEKGRLSLDPMRMFYSVGYSDFGIVIDASGSVPLYRLKIAGEDIDIDDVLARTHKPVIMSGSLNLVTDLQSSGESTREIAANLNGQISLSLENGQIWRIIDLLSKDPLDILLVKVDQRKYTDVHCLINKITFEDGIGTIDILSIDSPRIRARGAGGVNLRDETFELVINPQRKRRLFSRRSAVRLRGSLVDPSVSTIPLSEAAELYGTILLPFVFLPERVLGYLWSLMSNDDATPCTFEGG